MSTQSNTKTPLLRHGAIIVTGLAIAYLPSYIHKIMNALGVQVGPEGPPSVLIWNWLAVTLLIAYIIFVERQRLASILLVKPKKKDIEWAFWFWGIAMTTTWLMNILFPPEANKGTAELLSYSVPVIMGIIVTAAITEEILFRGYVIERLRTLTGQAWLAVGISFIIFILPHITFFGFEWLLYHGIGTVMIYVLYVWRKNLYACMLLHLLGNLPILLPALGLVK
jgi:uncharacterized protein